MHVTGSNLRIDGGSPKILVVSKIKKIPENFEKNWLKNKKMQKRFDVS